MRSVNSTNFNPYLSDPDLFRLCSYADKLYSNFTEDQHLSFSSIDRVVVVVVFVLLLLFFIYVLFFFNFFLFAREWPLFSQLTSTI